MGAYSTLGLLLSKQPDREAEAEQAYQQAIAEGIIEAYFNLGDLLARQPGREAEAEQALRATIEARNSKRMALIPLTEVEQAYRDAIQAGIKVAVLGLGLLLVQQSTRKLEGCEVLHRAEAIGIEGAAEALREFCT